jgi:hypothetical protein
VDVHSAVRDGCVSAALHIRRAVHPPTRGDGRRHLCCHICSRPGHNEAPHTSFCRAAGGGKPLQGGAAVRLVVRDGCAAGLPHGRCAGCCAPSSSCTHAADLTVICLCHACSCHEIDTQRPSGPDPDDCEIPADQQALLDQSGWAYPAQAPQGVRGRFRSGRSSCVGVLMYRLLLVRGRVQLQHRAHMTTTHRARGLGRRRRRHSSSRRP